MDRMCSERGHEATMERRKFIAAVGSVAAGGAAAVGTGAFTNVEASREVDVEVAGDSQAYLALRVAADDGTRGANSEAYVDDSGDEVSFDFSGSNSNVDGNGFNPRAITRINNILEVANQGTQSAFLSVDLAGLDLSDGSGNQAYVALEVADGFDGSVLNDNVAFDSDTPGSNVGGVVPDPTADGPHELGQGDSVVLNLVVDTTDFQNSDVSTSGDVTFIADQTDSL